MIYSVNDIMIPETEISFQLCRVMLSLIANVFSSRDLTPSLISRVVPLRVSSRRPKGLGLGATVVSKSINSLNPDAEQLSSLKKTSLVKIVGGIYRYYGSDDSFIFYLQNSMTISYFTLPIFHSFF